MLINNDLLKQAIFGAVDMFEEDGKQYSIQTLKLELYLEEVRGHTTRHIYRTKVKGNEGKLRRYRRKKK